MVERRVEGTTRSADDTERRRRRAVLATGTAGSVKYRGAAPVKQRCTSTHSHYRMAGNKDANFIGFKININHARVLQSG